MSNWTVLNTVTVIIVQDLEGCFKWFPRHLMMYYVSNDGSAL